MEWNALITPTLGAGGLVAIFVIMIFTGRMLPSRTVDRLLASKDEQITNLRTANEQSKEAIDRKDSQIAALLEAGKTTTHVIQAVQEAARLNSAEGRRNELAPSQDDA